MMPALVLAPTIRLSGTTRAVLRTTPWQRPPLARIAPTVEGWGLASYDAIPDLVIAEHADPVLFARLLSDLVGIRRALPLSLTIVVGEQDDTLNQHLLAPMPLPATVIHPAQLTKTIRAHIAEPQSLRTRTPTRVPALRWRTPAQPAFVLRHWRVVPLIAACDAATTMSQAAQWCNLSRAAVIKILAHTVVQLRLQRGWRHPWQWRDILLAALSYPNPSDRTYGLLPPVVAAAP